MAAITSTSNEEVKDGVQNGNFRVVFFTPELLLEHKRWRHLLQKEHYMIRLKGFIVDEAHTVSVK